MYDIKHWKKRKRDYCNEIFFLKKGKNKKKPFAVVYGRHLINNPSLNETRSETVCILNDYPRAPTPGPEDLLIFHRRKIIKFTQCAAYSCRL